MIQRFALRNKHKISEAFSLDYYNLLIKSLDKYLSSFEDATEVNQYDFLHDKYKVINVPDISGKATFFEFYVVSQIVNAWNLAYKGEFTRHKD